MKIRLIWDDCTPTRERRPTTSYDIEDDIHLEEFDNLDDLIDTLLDLTDYTIDDLVSEKPMDQIDELIGCLGDISDGSPNILFLSIDNNIIEDMLEDTDGLTCSEDDVKDEIKQYVEDDEDYDDDLDESLYESNTKPDSDKISSYNKGLELAKKINPDLKECFVASGERFVEDKNDKINLASLNCLICDMEIAGIARTCFLNKVRCLSIKCISDTFDGDGSMFVENVKKSSDKAFNLLNEILLKLN